jgi:hypothetical protein
MCQKKEEKRSIQSSAQLHQQMRTTLAMVSCPEHRQIFFSFPMICASVLALFIITVLFIRNISKENITQYIMLYASSCAESGSLKTLIS